ncbi:TonB-dependent receptor domain-containing protein [Luteimonas salinilitoris]|uniref:TonB-dependent receptor n=1 Tax=Luteimonas salinilitoris TaxID=3237697 RepID=A0ABV4HU18_9GAMM
MTLKTTKLRDAIVFALAVGATTMAGTGVAIAQDQQEQTDPTVAELDRITVTGTRIQSQTITASSPVAEIQKEEFQFAGATRVDDLVNQYPQLSPVFDSFENNGATGYPTVDLRGLGPQRTLTLVNGHRLPPGGLNVGFRDISIIPAALVNRVDILTGGASAVYGSDAIAGVVNFVLDTEFEGVSLTAGHSAYQHSNDNEYIQGLMDARDFDYPTGSSGFDGASNNIDIAIGSSFADGAGHAMAWLTWRKNDALFHGERDYSSCALTANGSGCGGSDTNATGNFYFFQTEDFLNTTPASLNPDGSYTNAYGAPYNYAPPNYYQRPDERYTFGSSLKYEVNEHFRPYLETMYVNKQDSIQIAESGAFFTLVDGLDCTTPFLGSACADLGLDPDLPVGVYVAKRNVEGGPRIFDSETSAFTVMAGAEGDINDNWSYNASYLIGHNSTDTQGFNDLLSDRIVDALVGCPPDAFNGCIPYNVWEPDSVTPEAAAALAGVSLLKVSTDLKVVNAYVTGDLGFGFGSAKGDTVSLVGGVEWREERIDVTPDSDSQAGNFAGSGGPTLPVGGKISVTELFLESIVPLVKDAGFIDNLNLDLGYRLSDYRDSETANTYKIGFSMTMLENYRLRGGYNRAIREPGINDLFAIQQLALFAGPDPCAGATPEFTQEQCANTGVSPGRYGSVPAATADQYNQFIGGNLELEPETADTWTLGFVATPLDNLQFSVDYYDVKITDTIDPIGAITILRFCGLTGDPFLCDKVQRNAATGDLWRGSDPNSSGFVENLTDNFGERRVRGIDLGASYRWDMLGGRVSASLMGSHVLENEFNPLPGVNDDAIYDCAGRINVDCQTPEWRHIANLRYARDIYTANLRWRYVGEMDYVDHDGNRLDTDVLLRDKGKLGAQNYIDLSGSILFGQTAEVTLGVNNIFDREPPMVGASLALNANAPGGYDQAGRFVFTNITFRF